MLHSRAIPLAKHAVLSDEGTDVAQEAAELVVSDDNFPTRSNTMG